MSVVIKTKPVAIPTSLLQSFIEASRQWDELSNQLEDFLLSYQPRFIKKMTRARQEHRAGKLGDFAALKRKLGY